MAKKGSVFITTTRGTVLPLQEFRKFAIKKSSKQLKVEAKWAGAEQLAARPYSPTSFLTLYESNPIFFATVNQIAIDVAGLGWKLLLKEGQKENEAEKKTIEDFLKRPNPLDSLRKICKSLLIDWGTIGYFGLEAVRSNDNKLSEIYHVPAHTLWVHTGKEKFCQRRELKKVWFKQFGLEKDFSSDDGKEGKYEAGKKANELIYYKTHYPLNDYYGVPNILPATGSVLGLIGIRDYNLSFFTNYGVPAYLVTLSGDWDAGAEKAIRDFMETEIKGSDNAHKTMVLQLPEQGTATFKPLSIEVKEGSFRVYQQVLREDILAAYSVPPYRIGITIIGKLGGSTAIEATRIYNQSVVEPLQEDLEDIINDKLIEKGLDCHSYKFQFNNLDIRDLDAEVTRYNSLIEHGAMTPNEMRERLDLGESYPGGDTFYISAALVEIGEAEIEKGDMDKRLKGIVEKKIRGQKMSDEEEKILKAEIEKRDRDNAED